MKTPPARICSKRGSVILHRHCPALPSPPGCCHHSTRYPPHKQLLVRLGAGGVSFRCCPLFVATSVLPLAALICPHPRHSSALICPHCHAPIFLAAQTHGFPTGIRYANQEVTQRRRLLQMVQAVNGNSGEPRRMCYTLRESTQPHA